MRSVAEIQYAIEHLPVGELFNLLTWVSEYANDRWDREMEADAKAGRFDAILERVRRNCEEGRCTEL